jgi:glycogen synthase
VGDGDRQYLSSLKEFQSRNKLDVIFCGFQSNPFQYLESLGVGTVIVPAIWQEAFGRVPIEGAINGFHVIVSATGGLLESGMQLEPQAIFYSPGNAKDLANILDVYKVPDQVTYVPPVNTFNSAINSALQKAKGIM